MIESFQVDETRWPIIRVTFPSIVTLEAYRGVFRQYVTFSKRGERIGYLIDMRQFNPLTASAAMRKGAAEVFAENRDALVKATVCEGRVVASSLTSGVLTAFDWLTGQKWPCANFTSMDEAARWVEKQMQKAGAHAEKQA
jgi:hypothetical protein